MNRSPSHIRLALLALAGALLLLLVAAPAAPAAGSVKKAQARLKAVQARLESVSTQSEIAVEKYNQASSQLDTVRAQIKENEHLLKVAQYNLELANQQLQSRAQSIYKTRDVGIVDVLFAASSFDELVTQLDMMERLGNSDVDIVHSINAYRADIKDRRLKLDADKKAAAKLVTERRAKKNEVLGLQNKLERLTHGIKAQIDALEAQAAAAARAAAQNPTDPSTGTPPSGNVDPGGPGHPEVVGIAQRYLGVPYVYGGASPNGFDCSGLAMFCYAQIGIGLAHGATLQQHASQFVSVNNLAPGDLVFFGGPSWSYHVGIYVGGGTMIDAPHTGAVVRYDGIGGAWAGGRF